jgi:HAD superfamily hydrolase (TIGR01509 family)
MSNVTSRAHLIPRHSSLIITHHFISQLTMNDEDYSKCTAFLFDLDGTLVDSVYQHVLAWREALEAGGMSLAVWRIHRQIGMSGGLFVNALIRETGHRVSAEEAERMQQIHGEAFTRYVSQAVVVTRDQVRHAKPDPDLFLAAADRLGVDINSSVVVGDSVWDMLAARRARALGAGLLSGGYGREELERAGAYRVYNDPADLLLHLDEIGVRRSE